MATTNKLTAKQVLTKYKGKYIDVQSEFDYITQTYLYEVRKAYPTIRENTTLVKDLDFYSNF